MKRIALIILLAAIGVGVIFVNLDRESDVTILNARAVAADGQADTFMLTFEVQNAGPAKTIASVHSPSARMVHVMNPGFENAALVIPEASNGIFAMDGAHVMVMGVEDGFESGASIPITVTFEDGSDVTTRALNASAGMGMGMMDHDMSQGIQSDPSPSISLSAVNGFSTDGADLIVDVENFTFSRVPDDAPHVPMEGHAHIYLNGLKLGRLYEPEFSLGALPSGAYELVVALNSNTHQPYMRDGEPVRAAISFQLD